MVPQQERETVLILFPVGSFFPADSYQYQLQHMWQKCWSTNTTMTHNLRFRERGPLKSWRPETMAEAIFSVLREGLSLSQAARKYDIPYPTFVLYANRVHNMLGPSVDGGAADLRPKGRGRPQRILLGIWPEDHIYGVIRAVVFRDPQHLVKDDSHLSYSRLSGGPGGQGQGVGGPNLGPSSTLNCAMGLSSPLGLRRPHSPAAGLGVLQGLQGLGQGHDVLEQVLSGRGAGLSALALPGMSSRPVGPLGSPPGQPQAAQAQPADLQDLRVASPVGGSLGGSMGGLKADRDRLDRRGDAGEEAERVERVCDGGERDRDRRKMDERMRKHARVEDGVGDGEADGVEQEEDDLRIARDFLNSANNNDIMTNNNMGLLKAGPLFPDEIMEMTNRSNLLNETPENVVVKCEPLLSSRPHSHS
ncbi:Protein bric-a-brac 1 [Frankliniella fusca]|uniref:Protein bric-a-brac 1 n=1 Tax=Frankliniella fusca TaxID=407009 RepID=A0AAE1I384_9NEOP|nr:Protein bric-a-brac 1 [Frankliniella fusca]